jgi:hypothetical protein
MSSFESCKPMIVIRLLSQISLNSVGRASRFGEILFGLRI